MNSRLFRKGQLKKHLFQCVIFACKRVKNREKGKFPSGIDAGVVPSVSLSADSFLRFVSAAKF